VAAATAAGGELDKQTIHGPRMHTSDLNLAKSSFFGREAGLLSPASELGAVTLYNNNGKLRA